MKTKMIAALSLFCLACNGLAALDTDLSLEYLFAPPSKNPTVEGYMSETMNSVVTGMTLNNAPCTDFVDLSLSYQYDLEYKPQPITATQFVLFQGVMIPLPEYVAFPLFWGIHAAGSASGEGDHGAVSVIAGSGIAVYGRFGAIAGCAGYNFVYAKDSKTDSDDMLHKLQWGVFPVINADEYPILHYFINLIDGYFRMDRDIFQPSYKANVLFKDIVFDLFDKETHWSLSAYTEKNWFNFDTKYTLHAGKLGLIIPEVEIEALDIDITVFFNAIAGYREFFDNEWNRDFYESGVYMKFGIGCYYENYGIQLTVESSVKPYLNGCYVGLFVSNKIGVKDNSKVGWEGRIGKHGLDSSLSARVYKQ